MITTNIPANNGDFSAQKYCRNDTPPFPFPPGVGHDEENVQKMVG
jgi:hypothetical protein